MKKLLTLLLVLTLLVGATGAIATAGSADDPLISLSFAKDWASKLVASMGSKAETDLKDFGSTVISASKAHPVSYATSYTLPAGSTMTLGTGCSMALTSGAAQVKIQNGSLVNATKGATVSNGSLELNQNYIVCENATVTVTAKETSVILASGEVSSSVKAIFSDVKPENWFYSYVMRGVELKLIHGMTTTTYEPNQTLTVAQSITLAAQIHQLNTIGSITLSPASSEQWYDPFRTYCIENSIIDASYANYSLAQMNTPATRGEFVHIFYHALPEDSYGAINAIGDDTIPDVKMTDANANEIYTFYRAGILGGYTNTPGYADHAFGADSSIRRSEVAVIVVHMVDPDTRLMFTID